METDLELLNNARMLDKEALVKIFDLYSSALFNYARRVCGDPVMADQIVGDVFAKLFDQFSAGRGPRSQLRSYLYEITYHCIVDEARYSRRIVSIEADEWLQQATPSEAMNLENKIVLRQIFEAMQSKLTNDQRHVVILRFLEGFSLRETAAIISKKAEHVKVIQSRAIAKLRQAIQDNDNRSVAS